MGSNMAAGTQQKHLSLSESANLSLEELKNIKITLFLIHEILGRNKSPTWQLCRPSCKCRAKQKLRHSSVVCHKLKPWTHWERKFVWILVFSCCYTLWKYNLRRINSFLVWILMSVMWKPPIYDIVLRIKKK